ncbi:MAG: S8 family peptidase [Candidatus Hodarchaeales archaeon]
MLKRFTLFHFSLLIFITGSIIFQQSAECITFTPHENYNLRKTSFLMNQKIQNPSLDLLFMFSTKIPKLESFNRYVIKNYSNFPAIHIKFDNTDKKQLFIKTFHKEIHSIEPNRAIRSFPQTTREINFKNIVVDTQIRESIGASYLYQFGINGSRTKIGIIDTGVNNDSEEFGARLKGQKSFVSIENGYSQDVSDPDDYWIHGKKVANLATGNTNGIAPAAEIYGAKIIHTASVTGAGEDGGEETTAGMLEAIDYLVDNEVDVINISLGQYHNLPSGMREEVIDYISIVHNIVFSISAGNSGTSYGDRGTLNNPSTALQCISVAASNIAGTDIASFSSKGPKIDYSLKPDISAPGLKTPEGDGTSFAAPIVAGGAALIIDFLKREKLSYSAATIKAALLAGARSMGKPIWEEGAGFINLTKSLEIINSSKKIQNVPDITYLHPTKLPFDPFEILFAGSSVTFNLTVICSRNISSVAQIPSSLSEFITTSSISDIPDISMLIPLNFSIPASTTNQKVTGQIVINNQPLKIEFEIRQPVSRILFDESLNRIVKHGYGTDMFEIQGDTSSSIGMYSAFTKYLAYENNYSVTPHISGELGLNYLKKFDVLILCNPFSLATDKYMDWVENPGTEYISLSQNSSEAVFNFVELGGGVMILSTDSNFYNITALNELLSNFDLQIQSESSGSIQQSFINESPNNFTKNISTFPFWGNYIQISGGNTQVIANIANKPTLASYQNSVGGKVLLYGSDLIFDNIGFSNNVYDENSEDNQILAFNSVAWLAEGETKEPTKSPEFPYLSLVIFAAISLGSIFILFLLRNKK